MHPDRQVTRAGVVRFDKRRVKFEAMELDDLRLCQDMFLAAARLWQINTRRLMKKMVPDK
jgi:hypothetical protein